MRKPKKIVIYFFLAAILLIIFCRLYLGIFVVQPIGAIPDGTTIIYWRGNLNLPFVSSPDGLAVKSGAGLSLLSRGIMLGAFIEPIKKRELLALPYSEFLYLWSTDGIQYDK